MNEGTRQEWRTNEWLAGHLAEIWCTYFKDVPKLNPVYTKFGRRSRTRLGSIQLIREGQFAGASVITLSGYMTSYLVPDYVLTAVLAHELIHYAHGFQSPLPRLCRYPHQGGIVDKEIRRRGLGSTLKEQKVWVRAQWIETIKELK